MNFAVKKWNYNDYYDFVLEFNRIESYNEYCKQWLSYYGINLEFISKTNWKEIDIVDLQAYNRVKANINSILKAINGSANLTISSLVNQVWNVEKANELENKLQEYLQLLGTIQFMYNVVSSTTNCGNNLKLKGVV